MILINQLDNKIGGTERQTRYLVNYFEKAQIEYVVCEVPKLRYLNQLRFVFGVVKLLYSTLMLRPKTVYIMTDVVASGIKGFIFISTPYCLYLLFSLLLPVRFVVRLCAVGKFESISRRVPAFVLRKVSFITNSSTEKERVLAIDSKIDVKFVPNGTDQVIFKPSKKCKDCCSEFVYGYIGRFSKEKNLDTLILSYSKLPKEVKEKSRLIMIGYDKNCCLACDAYYEKLISIVKQRKLLDKVYVRELIPFGEERLLAKAYNGLDVYVLPSKIEGLSNSVIESISCGIPVIVCSQNLAVRELSDRCLSWVFDDINAQDLSKAMEKAFYEKEKIIRSVTKEDLLIDYNIENTSILTAKYLIKWL